MTRLSPSRALAAAGTTAALAAALTVAPAPLGDPAAHAAEELWRTVTSTSAQRFDYADLLADYPTGVESLRFVLTGGSGSAGGPNGTGGAGGTGAVREITVDLTDPTADLEFFAAAGGAASQFATGQGFATFGGGGGGSGSGSGAQNRDGGHGGGAAIVGVVGSAGTGAGQWSGTTAFTDVSNLSGFSFVPLAIAPGGGGGGAAGAPSTYDEIYYSGAGGAGGSCDAGGYGITVYGSGNGGNPVPGGSGGANNAHGGASFTGGAGGGGGGGGLPYGIANGGKGGGAGSAGGGGFLLSGAGGGNAGDDLFAAGSLALHATDATPVLTVSTGASSCAHSGAGSVQVFVTPVPPAPSTTTVSASVASSPYPGTSSVTAHVAAQTGGATATGGSVTFTVYSGATPVGTASSSSPVGGDFTADLPDLPVGVYTVSAAYSGGGLLAGSASTTSATLSVVPAATATTAGTVISPIAGVALALTAHVANTSTGATPAGTVSFTIDGETVASAIPLDAGGDAATTVPAPGYARGHHELVATFSGSADFTASTSTAVDLAVRAETTVSTDYDAILVAGRPAQIAVTVTAADGSVPVGSVSVDGGTPAALDAAGTATLSLTPATAGTGLDSTVRFEPATGALWMPSQLESSIDVSTAAGAASTLDVTATPTVVQGEPAMLSASAADALHADIPGAGDLVSYSDLAAEPGVFAPSAVGATSVVFDAPGVHTIRGELGGASDEAEVVVTADTVTTAVLPDPDDALPVVGRDYPVHVSVESLVPGTGVPEGTVVLRVDGVVLPETAAPLVDGGATLWFAPGQEADVNEVEVLFTAADEDAEGDPLYWNDSATAAPVLVDPLDLYEATDEIRLVPTRLTAVQGDTIQLGAFAYDANGDLIADVSDLVTLESDWAEDRTGPGTVTFGHASPHVITATLRDPDGAIVAQATVTIEVSPLVATGVETLAPLSAALGVLLAGIALLTARRRRATR